MIRDWIRFFCAPQACLYCRTILFEDAFLCESCTKFMQPLISQDIEITALHSMRVFSMTAYKEPFTSLILAKNSQNRTASKCLGQLMAKNLPESALSGDYFVPIPLHWTRYARRGFNHAEIIARELAGSTKKPLVKALKKIRRTEYQVALDAKERVQNVRNAFVLAKGIDVVGKHIVLVDDLMTTGSTLRAAARALIAAKAARVTAVVACRAV